MLKIDGHDKALIGRADPWDSCGSKPARLVYNGHKIMQSLMRGGMTHDEAMEYIEFNIEGAYVGEHTPIIVWPATMDEVEEMEWD